MSEQDLESLLKRHTQNLTKIVQTDGKKQYSCHVDGDDEYEAFVTDLNALGFSFYTRSAKANESSRALFSYAKKEGDLQIPFFGSPFQIMKSSYMYCSMDGNYKPTTRPTLSADQPSAKKFRFSAQPTKKVGCQAVMRVKCLRIFEEDCYKLVSPYKRHCRSKNKILCQLGKDLTSSCPPTSIVRFMIIMSAAEEHNHSVGSTNHNQRLHPRLREEIYNLVRASPDCTTKSVKAHLREVVRVMFEESAGPRPDTENRCYYPIDHVIRFHVYQAHAAVDRGGHDQDVLAEQVRAWIREYPEDDFYFRPRAHDGRKNDVDRGDSLLFCHQTKWQRHLLRRYGNDICLLDAAHKTCKYGFPLYFLVVKTNASDCIAGTFVVQRETAALITEALSHFQAWCPEWDPEYFLADRSEEETDALGRAFPRAAVYVSAFHREQSWDRWLNKKGNVSRRSAAAIRRAWQTVAGSRTEDEYAQNLQDMYDLDVYQDSSLAQSYFFTEWLPVHQKWVEAFQRKDFVSKMNINNGTDCQRSVLQHTYLTEANEKTLSGVVKVVVERLLADLLEKYSLSNIPLDYREYTDTVPEFLRNRPIPFIESVMLRYEEAKEYDASLINDMGEGLFIVRSEVNVEEWCSVDFLEATCSCFDFGTWRVPCRHMCAAFIHTEWGFDRLPAWYREHPYVTVDEDYAGEVGVKIDFDGADIEEQTSMEVEVDANIARDEETEDALETEEDALEVEEDTLETGEHALETGEQALKTEEDAHDTGEDALEMETTQEMDIETLMENTRERLLAILGYTYLEHDPEDAVKLANSVVALNEEISSSTAMGGDERYSPTQTGIHFLTTRVPEPSPDKPTPRSEERPAAVKPRKGKAPKRVKKEPSHVLQRTFPKLKIGKKHVGRCVMPAHQWRQYVTEKVDMYPPQTVDQIVVIDFNHQVNS